jgi:hypothetical protein
MTAFYHRGMAYDEALAGRVRAALSGTGTTEKKMFGGLVFMTGDHLTVGVYGDGLIARAGLSAPARHRAMPSRRKPSPRACTGPRTGTSRPSTPARWTTSR